MAGLLTLLKCAKNPAKYFAEVSVSLQNLYSYKPLYGMLVWGNSDGNGSGLNLSHAMLLLRLDFAID